ncbi:MAG: methyltransferase type 11 [Candidatus Cloacimonetes bacterium 4572_55]|nr:MAG: methyltransferase type 11 [Candidatus Cloacimonetes bacterium 4572_55]
MAERVCPVWVGYLLASPVRKLFQNPEKILAPYVEDGMKVLDVGCAMGFFSLPLARMIGLNGKVICVDVQEKMIKSLEKRALKAGLINRIETRICRHNSLGLDDLKGKIDFAFASAVVHEVPDTHAFFSQTYETIKPDGTFFVLEPKGHVSEKDFGKTISVAKLNGFNVIDSPKIGRSRSILLGKNKSSLYQEGDSCL